MEKQIQKYLNSVALPGSHTYRAKEKDLCKFASAFPMLKIEEVESVHVRGFVHYLQQKGEAPSTINRRISTLKHFFNLLCEERPTLSNPTKHIKCLKLPDSPPKRIKNLGIHQIIAAAILRERSQFKKLRAAAILWTLYATGSRVGEVTALIGKHDHGEMFVNVPCKAGVYRDLPIPSPLREILDNYLIARAAQIRTRLSITDTSQLAKFPIFISFKNATRADPQSFRMSNDSIRDIFRRVALALKVNLHPHMMRHDFAYRLHEQTKNIALVQKALGHTSIMTTSKYTGTTLAELSGAIEDLAIAAHQPGNSSHRFSSQLTRAQPPSRHYSNVPAGFNEDESQARYK